MNQSESAVNVATGLTVKRDVVGTGFGKHRDDFIDRLNHQVYVNGRLYVGANSLADQGADSEVGDIVIVHDVKVDPIGTGSDHIAYLLAESGKVR